MRKNRLVWFHHEASDTWLLPASCERPTRNRRQSCLARSGLQLLGNTVNPSEDPSARDRPHDHGIMVWQPPGATSAAVRESHKCSHVCCSFIAAMFRKYFSRRIEFA